MASGEQAIAQRPVRPVQRPRPRGQRGAGYLLLLFAMAAMGLLLASAGEVWHTSAQREREAQLLFVGHQFRLALASYREHSPQGLPTAPATLDELLTDRRHPVPKTHLRRLWRDPVTNQADWALVRHDGRIVAVHSRSERAPLRTAFTGPDAAFVGLGSYAQWHFSAADPRPAATASLPPHQNPP